MINIEFLKKIIKFKNNNKDYSNVLTKKELNQLEVFNKINRFNEIYNYLINNQNGFSKKDVLWAIYNECRIEYENSNDLVMLSVVFDRQTDILINDKKYKDALDIYIVSLYCLLYNYNITSKEVNLFDRHFNERRNDKLNKLLKHNEISKGNLKELFEICVQENLPKFFDKAIASTICLNIIKRL